MWQLWQRPVDIHKNAAGQILQAASNLLIPGDPGPIRTGDLPLRRGTLYPAELRGQGRHCRMFVRLAKPAGGAGAC